jgi:hypothetical protein
MTAEEVEIALKEFAEQVADWMPKRDWIKTFSLTQGITFIMKPGTIHAPITATDCLCRGGMCFDKRFFVSDHLPRWAYIAKKK